MSEITAEGLAENHIKHLRQLTIEEVGTETLDALCRDAVQAAMLLGYRRATPKNVTASGDQLKAESVTRSAFKIDGCWYPVPSDTLPDQPLPPVGELVEVQDQFGGIRQARWTEHEHWRFERPTPWNWIIKRWRPPQPATPAQPEGEKPPRDYRDDLLSCAKADAERLRNAVTAAEAETESVRIRMNYLENVVNENLRQERDEAQEAAANANGECAELHRILETIRRVADSKP